MENLRNPDLPRPKADREKDTYDDLIEKVATKVVAWRMSIPAIMVLESAKPLSFVASQALVFLEPLVQAFLNPREYRRFYEMLENRENVERLIQAIERKEEEYQAAQKAQKKQRKEAR